MATVPDAASDLAAAVRAYDEAKAEIAQAETHARQLIAEARFRAEQRRLDLAAAIARAARAGIRQRDIIAVTSYTREHVRRIVRAGGVEAE
jgi:hypothetical protein